MISSRYGALNRSGILNAISYGSSRMDGKLGALIPTSFCRATRVRKCLHLSRVSKLLRIKLSHRILPDRMGDSTLDKAESSGKVHEPQLGNSTGSLKQINKSLYEFYAPEGKAEQEVVFFHGLQPPTLQPSDYREAYWQTWLKSESTLLWPKAWLPKQFPNARVLTVSYLFSAQKGITQDGTDLDLIADALVQDLILQGGIGQNPRCPLVLVGHSLGGVVLKKVILNATSKLGEDIDGQDIQRLESFLKNVRGVFYFASPHNGCRMADFKNMKDFLKELWEKTTNEGANPCNDQQVGGIPVNEGTRTNEVLNFLTALNEECPKINDDFKAWRRLNRTKTATIVESLSTHVMDNRLVVTEGPARFDSDSLHAATADHFGVCRLESPTALPYRILTNFIASWTGKHEWR
ncbi:hypothetical protein R1flu_014313 [Riccia fluitans]|uniref:DUF676 domain-containing protein n=1 Tax=Riccia fluitans TaxID=41844 RepID=A0ABD1YFV3_9MARC